MSVGVVRRDGVPDVRGLGVLHDGALGVGLVARRVEVLVVGELGRRVRGVALLHLGLGLANGTRIRTGIEAILVGGRGLQALAHVGGLRRVEGRLIHRRWPCRSGHTSARLMSVSQNGGCGPRPGDAADAAVGVAEGRRPRRGRPAGSSGRIPPCRRRWRWSR